MLGQEDLKVMTEIPVLRENKVFKALRELGAKLERKALKDHQGHKGNRGLRDHLAQQVRQVQRDLLGLQQHVTQPRSTP